MKKVKVMQIACIYIGIIFGAGFASGQELIAFFLGHGLHGIFGIIFASILLTLAGWAIMDICVRENLSTYRSFMAQIFGKKLGAILDIGTSIFIFIIFAAMLAGAGALGAEAWGLPFSFGVVVLALLCFIILLYDVKGLVEINTFISPILVIGSIFIGIYAIFNQTSPTYAQTLGNIVATWPFSAAIYASYNLLTAVAVFSSVPSLVTSRRVAFFGALAGGVTVAVLGVIISVAMLANHELISGLELPMLGLSMAYGNILGYLYIILLFLAIFTTAVANGFSCISWLKSRTSLNSLYIKLIVIILAIFIAHLGFSYIVGYAYRIFGYLGLYIMFAVIIHALLRKKI